MKKFIVCIYDKVAGVYSLFADFQNKGVILRTFTDLLSDNKFVCSAHPEDYDIVIIGELDVHTGVLFPMSEKIANCNDLVVNKTEA